MANGNDGHNRQNPPHIPGCQRIALRGHSKRETLGWHRPDARHTTVNRLRQGMANRHTPKGLTALVGVIVHKTRHRTAHHPTKAEALGLGRL